MIDQGLRRQPAVAFSTTLLVIASTISIASAFSPSMLVSQITMRRSGIKARLVSRNAGRGLRSSFTLVHDSIEKEEDIRNEVLEEVRNEVLENVFDNILSNKGFDQVLGSALRSIHPPHYEKLASALPSWSNLHLHLHLPEVTAHTVSAAHPAAAMDLASIEHLLATLPVWALLPGLALLASPGAFPLSTIVSVKNSAVPFHRVRPEAEEESCRKAWLTRGERIKAALAAQQDLHV